MRDGVEQETKADGTPTVAGGVVGVTAGVGAAIAGAFVWYLAVDSVGAWMTWLAVPLGAVIGYVVSRGLRGAVAGIVAGLLVIVAMGFAQNLVQRAALQEGIEELDRQWDELSLAATAPPGSEPPGGFASAPPPEIVPMIPLEGLLQMPPEVMADVWEHIPEETREQIPEERTNEVEHLLAGGELPEEGDDQQGSDNPIEDEAFAIPRPVLECAPPPDFTQPDAAAGLGFPDGVPFFLPAADLFGDAPERGDGEQHDPPTPTCFAIEHAKDQPFEAVMWLLALVTGITVGIRGPFRRHSGAFS